MKQRQRHEHKHEHEHEHGSALADEARARALYASGELVESDTHPGASGSGPVVTVGGGSTTMRLVEFDATARAARDPRVFKFLPRGMERGISPAGRPTEASDHVPLLLDQFD